MRISLVAGERSDFVQTAAIARALGDYDLRPRVIYAGQHCDDQLSRTFFDELNLREPDTDLGVGAGQHVWQAAEIMRRLGHEFTNHRPDVAVVIGDGNASPVAALTACKLGIPVAHVEAGLRSFDRTVPEEMNRVVTDTLSTWLFTSEPSAEANLREEGVPSKRIHPVGNLLVDAVLRYRDCARLLPLHGQLGVTARNYAVLAVNRPSTLDHPDCFASVLHAVHLITQELPVIFPMHPRAEQRLHDFEFRGEPKLNGFVPVAPQDYVGMLHILDAALFVMTDSGPVQDQAASLQVPCLTLADTTERLAAVEAGGNRLVGHRTEDIVEAARSLLRSSRQRSSIPDSWDGRAAQRLAAVLTHDGALSTRAPATAADATTS